MKPAPSHIHDARVICYSPIDERHVPTGGCVHKVNDLLVGAASGLAICRYYEDHPEVILYYCDSDWNVLTHGHHPDVDAAKDQAEFEYTGVSKTWNNGQQLVGPQQGGVK